MFFGIPKNQISNRFSSVLGLQNRPKIVSRWGPQRVSNAAPFFNGFSSGFPVLRLVKNLIKPEEKLCFLQHRALRCGSGKSSISEWILEPKTHPKSIKMGVRKWIQIRAPLGSNFYRFSAGFGSPGRPPGDAKNGSWGLPGRPRGAPGRVLEA